MFTRSDLNYQRLHSKMMMRAAVLAAATVGVVNLTRVARGQDVSPPVILQNFESSWANITNRMPDIFAAGYGGVYTPPPGRAESGNQSVGYDAYDRFDLGSPGNPTLYGTATGLKQMVNSIHQMGGSSYIDLVWNQSGFADTGTSGFAAAGGYPGFALTLQNSNSSAPGYNTQGINAVDGDYHSSYNTGDQQERLAGLVDIAQESNNVFIRQPTTAGPDNIPGPTPGASAWFYTGLANVPNAANAQFYPDKSLNPISVYNPNTGQGDIKIYPYNLANPMAGTPVAENALGYLMRYTQYMVQVVGADGFRVDAAKNMPEWVMNYLDQATYRSSFRTLLNGQQENIFSFSEVYTSDTSVLQPYISKTINPNDIGTIGGNRDVLDFPLFFAMQQNLSSNGYQNDWRNMTSASIDINDNRLMDGSQGVKFVSSQDNGPPALDNVAYAYTLMLPGNAIVYDNSQQFGTGRSFPQAGRSDALGGMYGNTIPTLVDLRNRYGRGNYIPEKIDDGSGNGYQYLKNEFAFERQGSCLVLLSNRTDSGYDSRTVKTDFLGGTPLIEQTGNAASTSADPTGVIPQLIVINSDGTANVNFLRNSAPGTNNFTGAGYLVYGLATPQGSMSLTNVNKVMQNATPAGSSNADSTAYANATTLLASIDVITSSSFQIQLNTIQVNLLGYYRDHPADGDNALFKVDDGTIILNGDGGLDNTAPGNVAYGFQNFNTVHSPGYVANNGAGGNGSYAQTINTSQLSQGYHYISIDAFRFRNDSGPAVFTDWKQTIYIDTAPANSAPVSFSDVVAGTNENRYLNVQSIDGLANNVHTFLDLPFGLTDAQVVSMVGSGTQANQLDVNLWQHQYNGVSSGNHTVTVVSYKPDGSTSVQRFSSSQDAYLTTSTAIGAGIGDLNYDGYVNATDISQFITVVQSSNQQFNPAADVNGDGYVDLADTFLLGPVLSTHNVDSNTWTAYNNFIFGVGNNWVSSHTYTVNGTNNIYQDTAGQTNVSSGSTLVATYVRGLGLSIAAGGTAQIQSNPTKWAGTSRVFSLSVAGSVGAWTSKLDVTNNAMVVESTSANLSSDFARLNDMVHQGYDGGKWDGNGITSSTAGSDSSNLHALGIIVNQNSNGSTMYHTYDGVASDSNSILIDYTYYGDANLDGKVDGSDYSRIDFGDLLHLTGWANGDFNYDGVVNGSDYTLIDNAYNTQGPAGAAPAALLTNEIAIPTSQLGAPVADGGDSSVPEPSSLALLALGSAALLGRRTKGRQARMKTV